MKHDDKKHFDISKPRRQGPDPTSKPVIVGHHPMMPDPMIREEREKAAKPINVISEGNEPESLDVTQNAKPATQPDLSDISAPHEISPALTPSAPTDSLGPDQSSGAEPVPQPETSLPTTTPESAPGAVFSPAEASHAESSTPEPKMPEAPATPTITRPLESITKDPIPPTPPEPPAGQELHIPAGQGHAAVHHKPRIWVWGVAIIIILIWVYAAMDALTDTKLPVEFFKNLAP